jgi:hypothetical protein
LRDIFYKTVDFFAEKDESVQKNTMAHKPPRVLMLTASTILDLAEHWLAKKIMAALKQST